MKINASHTRKFNHKISWTSRIAYSRYLLKTQIEMCPWTQLIVEYPLRVDHARHEDWTWTLCSSVLEETNRTERRSRSGSAFSPKTAFLSTWTDSWFKNPQPSHPQQVPATAHIRMKRKLPSRTVREWWWVISLVSNEWRYLGADDDYWEHDDIHDMRSGFASAYVKYLFNERLEREGAVLSNVIAIFSFESRSIVGLNGLDQVFNITKFR